MSQESSYTRSIYDELETRRREGAREKDRVEKLKRESQDQDESDFQTLERFSQKYSYAIMQHEMQFMESLGCTDAIVEHQLPVRQSWFDRLIGYTPTVGTTTRAQHQRPFSRASWWMIINSPLSSISVRNHVTMDRRSNTQVAQLSCSVAISTRSPSLSKHDRPSAHDMDLDERGAYQYTNEKSFRKGLIEQAMLLGDNIRNLTQIPIHLDLDFAFKDEWVHELGTALGLVNFEADTRWDGQSNESAMKFCREGKIHFIPTYSEPF